VNSKQYRDLCAAFYVGLAALQSGEDVHARDGLERSTQIAPGEPAGWADLGILQVRQQEFDAAFNSVEKAHSLAPANSQIESLLGLIESKRGNVREALAHFQKAVSLDGKNLKALYSLAEETERQGIPGSDRRAEEFLNQILKAQPGNLAVLLDVARLAAKSGDVSRLRQTVALLRPLSVNWPDRAKTQFASVEQQAAGSNTQAAAVPIQFLRNVLLRVPGYRQSLDQVRTPATLVAEPFVRFLRLPSPSSEPARPDMTLAFEPRELTGAASDGITWVGAIALDSQSSPAILWADSTKIHIAKGVTIALPKPESMDRTTSPTLPRNAITGADLNYDFKTDLIVATPGGLRLYQQIDPRHFSDTTRKTKLPLNIVNGAYTGAWAFDIDLDGDLDIVLGVPHGEPVVLRNNGDGTFTLTHPFKGVNGLREFAAADIDGDGDPDVALVDGDGKLTVFSNERLGEYRRRATPAGLSEHNLDVAAADVNGDGLLDFVLLRDDSSVVRLSDRPNGAGWDFAVLARVKPPTVSAGGTNLILADVDNNGALDLVVGDQVFLSDGKQFVSLPVRLNANCQGVGDSNSDGRLDLLALAAGQAGTARVVELTNHGAKNYRWQVIRTRAAQITGDQRINSFGIGGEIEVRSDLLTQKQVIDSSFLHFGLGDRWGAEFARIEWPNGIIQTEFNLKANQTLRAEQRLKGSCPLLFTWNGRRMQFVKDVTPMSGALGAHDTSGRLAAISQTREQFKIAGDQLHPRDGFYDLRLTDEYWETYYMDYYGLAALDHPAGTHVFIDERVAEPPVPSKIYVTRPPREFQSARDERGRDVGTAVRDVDGTYLNTFELGAYQGVAHDHWVELELPPDADRHGPLYLIGDGWLHPWDDSILVAVNQGRQEKPKDLSIEVPDREGRWRTAKRDLGIPAGRSKTVVLDLAGVLAPGAPPKFRLRTNLEIYWDRLAWATGLPQHLVREQQLPLVSAELHYRGFSQFKTARAIAPEIPIYDSLSSTGGKWQNLEGYYTRYGDVLPLLNNVDDRFVITASGDELHLKFRAASPVKPGCVRDYVFLGDGWMKEGDYSFKHSATVLPLPSHSMRDYTPPLTALEDDPAYRRHPADWSIYHTRYITPKYFLTELWNH
jgi:hypothetical protein